MSEGTFPSLVSSLTYYLYIGQGNVAQFAVDYYLGDPPTVSGRGGAGGAGPPYPQLKTDTPIEDSCNGLQKTIGFCNFCFTTAIGVSLFGHQFHYVSCKTSTFANLYSRTAFHAKAIFNRCMVRNPHFCHSEAFFSSSKNAQNQTKSTSLRPEVFN